MREKLLSGDAPILSDDQASFFDANGYLVVRGITSLDDIASLRDMYECMFRFRIGLAEGNLFDLTSAGPDVNKLPQMTSMAQYEPALRDTLLWRNVRIVARQLLGRSADYIYDHGIRKPPRGPATPWHQDHAYYDLFTRYRAVAFWVPLQDATIENGCMWFVPGSNRGPLLTHQSLDNNPRIHALEIVDPAAYKGAVSCPVRAGDCTIHHPLTIHGTGVNLADEPRLAYTLGFGTITRRALVRREFSWNVGKDTARQRRHLESLSPFGKIKHLTRQAAKKALIRSGLY